MKEEKKGKRRAKMSVDVGNIVCHCGACESRLESYNLETSSDWRNQALG